MAQRVLKHVLQRRLYSASAAKPSTDAQRLAVGEVQMGQAANGIRVVTQDNHSALARVSCCVKAGSRYEDASQRGVAHCLRTISDLTQRQERAFSLVRYTQQLGANITCTTTRDHMIYTAEVTKNNLSRILPLLAGMVAQPSLRPWEISDNIPRIETELLALTEQADKRVIEAVHRAAYREKGYGRSLYSPMFQLGEFSPDLLREYINKNYTPDRITLSGVGVDYDQLLAACVDFDTHQPASGEKSSDVNYYGGEIRENSEDLIAYTTIVSEGAAANSKDVWAFAVLEQLLGHPPQIKWSSNCTSNQLNKAVSQSTDLPYSVQAFNVNYADSGLFGVNAVTVPENSATVLKTVMDQLNHTAQTAVSAEQLAGAKNRVKSIVAFQSECWADVVESRAVELQNTGTVSDLQQTMQAIEGVHAVDVQRVAKSVIHGKMSMASVGELCNTPYLDELKA